MTCLRLDLLSKRHDRLLILLVGGGVRLTEIGSGNNLLPAIA